MFEDDEMKGSEFVLTPEEQAEYDAQEEAENTESPEEESNLTNAEIDALFGKGGEEGKDNGEGDNNTPEPEKTPVKEPDSVTQEQDQVHEQQQQLEQDYQNWQEKLEQATEAKNTLLDDIEALGKQLDDGDIGEGEYQAKKARLEDRLNDHKREIGQAEQGLEKANKDYQSFADQQLQVARNQWNVELRQFAEAHPAYNPNHTDQRYAIRFDEVLADLREKQVLNGLSFKQVIATVQHWVEMELGKPEQVVPVTEKKKIPKREKVDIPTTLNQVQTLEPNPTSGDEFAAINRLSGIAYDNALAKLQVTNPEAYRRYMAE